MKLKDADALIDKSYWHGEMPTYDNPFPNGHDAVDVEDIENAPTIDAVPVVRCKDCNNLTEQTMEIFGEEHRWCRFHGWRTADWYCASAERKEV